MLQIYMDRFVKILYIFMNISEKNFCLFNFAMQIAKSVLWKYHTRIIKKNTNNLYSY